MDSTGVPIVSADVRVVVAGIVVDSTRTSNDGRFVVLVASPSSGATELVVRRMGFQPRTVVVAPPADSAERITVVLDGSAVVLSEMQVEAPGFESVGWLAGFNARRQRNSFGRFLTRDSIAAAHALRVSDLLRVHPGVRVMLAQSGGFLVRMRGCRVPPLVWVDGVRLPQAEVDEVAQPEDIAGMEVYTSMAGVPAQFMDRANRGCGTVLIWTRTR